MSDAETNPWDEPRTKTKVETDTDRAVNGMFQEEEIGELVVRRSLDYGDFVGFMQARKVTRDHAALLREAQAIGAQLGTDAFYRWTAGGKVIEGLSVRAAYNLCTSWGYNASRVAIIEQQGSKVLFSAVYIDLLTMAFVERPHSANLRSPPAKFDRNEDEKARWMTMQINSEASKAVRSAILNGLPQWYKDAAWDAAESAEVAKVGDLKKATIEAIQAYKGMATPEQLEAFIGRPQALWNPAAIVQLRALFKAIRNQETSVEAAFGSRTPDAPRSDSATQDTTRKGKREEL